MYRVFHSQAHSIQAFILVIFFDKQSRNTCALAQKFKTVSVSALFRKTLFFALALTFSRCWKKTNDQLWVVWFTHTCTHSHQSLVCDKFHALLHANRRHSKSVACFEAHSDIRLSLYPVLAYTSHLKQFGLPHRVYTAEEWGRILLKARFTLINEIWFCLKRWGLFKCQGFPLVLCSLIYAF